MSIHKSEEDKKEKGGKQMKFFKTDDHQQEKVSNDKQVTSKTVELSLNELPKVLLVDDTVFNLMIL